MWITEQGSFEQPNWQKHWSMTINQRSHPRYSGSNIYCEYKLKNLFSRYKKCPLLDINTLGAGVLVSNPVDDSEIISIRLAGRHTEEVVIQGYVRYCTKIENGYRVGVKFLPFDGNDNTQGALKVIALIESQSVQV